MEEEAVEPVGPATHRAAGVDGVAGDGVADGLLNLIEGQDDWGVAPAGPLLGLGLVGRAQRLQGLDIDALRIVSEGVNTLRGQDDRMGVLLITHYKRILGYLQPDHVHVMLNGRIAHSGGPELADQLEEMGYDWLHEPEPEPVG